MASRALPDVKSRVLMDTSGLARAEAQAKATGATMGAHFGKASGASKLLQKDLHGLASENARVIPGLNTMGSSLAGIPLPALAVVGAAGLLIETGMKVVEVSDKWEAAQRGLKQATEASGGSLEQNRQFVDKFISSNTKYVKSQDEVVDAYAAFIRQGVAAKTAQQDLNLAMDLAAIKHISLTEASKALQKMEAGKGKALIDLGITMKDYPVLMEDAHAANLKLQAAEVAVTKATVAHTAAVKAHGAQSPQAKAAALALADANAKLAEAHSYAERRAAASAEVHALLTNKLKGGREQTADLTQVQNQLGNVWQSFAIKTGPALTNMLVQAEKVLIVVVSTVLDAITVMGTWKGLWDVLGKIMGAVAWIIKTDVTIAFAVARVEIGLIIAVVKDLVTWFQAVVDTVKNVIHFIGQIKVPNINLPFGIGGPAARAGGGPVVPGQIYKVNENTPNSELWSPSVPGTVIPSGGAGSGVGATFNLHVHGNAAATNPDDNRRMLQRMAFIGLAAR